MNEKISLPDLIDLLAQRLNLPKKDSELFLKELFNLATDIVSSGESLRIDGLGLFKPTWVEKRTSVNIQTGQPFEILGHYKLSFIPDKALRDTVNSPFSCFEAEVLPDDSPIITENEELKFPTASEVEEEDNEGVEIVSDFSEETFEEKNESMPIEDLPQEIPTQEESDQKMHLAEEAGSEVPVHAIFANQEIETQTDNSQKFPEQPVNTNFEIEEETDERELADRFLRRHFYWKGFFSAIYILLCIVLVVGGSWYFFFYQDEPLIESVMISDFEKEKEIPVLNNNTLVLVDSVNNDTVNEPVRPLPRKEDKNDDEFVNIVTIQPGVFLTTIALEYYGSKAFWIYIYEENKNVIKNPDSVPVDTRIVVPPPSKYGIDADNPASIQRARKRAVELLQDL